MLAQVAKRAPITVCRAVAHRAATGKTEIYYSYERPRWWQLGRWWRLWKHIRFMRAEDRAEGY